MNASLDWKRIGIFLGFAFGIAWAIGLVIYLTGGLQNSPQLIPGVPGVTLAFVLLATVYMFAPTFANLLTRLLTREGFGNAGIRPYFKQGWPYWVAAWVLPPLLTVVGAAVFFAIYPQYFGGMSALEAQFTNAGMPVPDQLLLIVALQLGASMLYAPLLNGLFTFGEEWGWRGYLLPKLMPLGAKKAMLAQGAIWGVWHWPVIMMGYEYGFDYVGFPWVGMLLFLVFTFAAGTLLAWVTLRGRSVWPAVMGHAMLNAFAALSVPFTTGEPPMLLGPLPVGVIGMVGYVVAGLVLFFWPGALKPQEPNSLPLPEKMAEVRAEEVVGTAS